MSIYISRDFNLVVDETVSLDGILQAVTAGGIEPQRADFKAGGSIGNREPIVGFKFKPFKFKVIAYPEGFDTLAMGQEVQLSFYDYYVDETTQAEMGIRHVYRGEIDPPTDSERKADELNQWDYEIKNQVLYQKFKNDQLLDELSLDKNAPLWNGQEYWPNRKRFLGI